MSGETDILLTDAEAKKQELDEAKALIDDVTQQLKSENLYCPVKFQVNMF